VLNPLERLGGGHSSSENQIDKLKSHPFFQGIDFETLSTTQPPPIVNVSTPKSGESTPSFQKISSSNPVKK